MSRPTTASLFGDLDVDVAFDAPIGVESWFCTGGTADLLLRPADARTLAEVVRRCRRLTARLEACRPQPAILQVLDLVHRKLDVGVDPKQPLSLDGCRVHIT